MLDTRYDTRARGFPPFFVVDDQMVLLFSLVFFLYAQSQKILVRRLVGRRKCCPP
jgi:hypothetical protein